MSTPPPQAGDTNSAPDNPQQVQATALHIKEAGYAAAKQALKNTGIIAQFSNHLTIGQGSALESTITKDAQGAVIPTTQLAGSLPLQPTGPHDPTRFDTLHQAMKRRARNAILTDLILHLGIPAQSDTPHPNETLITDPKVRRQVSQTALKAVRDHLNTNAPWPRQVEQAYRKLHDFIGQNTVRETIRTAGQAATLRDLSTFTLHHRTFAKAAAIHPNATMLSITAQPRASNQTPPADASSVIDQLHRAFIQACTNPLAAPPDPWQVATILEYAPNGRPTGGSNAPVNNADLHRLWTIFTNLNTRALGRVRLKSVQNTVLLCKAVSMAGTQPHPEATVHLLEKPHLIQDHTLRTAALYIRESSLQPEYRQPALALQLDAINAYTAEYNHKRSTGPFNPWPLRDALNPRNPNPPEDWQQLMNLAPQWVRETQGNPEDRNLVPSPKYPFLRQRDVQLTAESILGDELRLMMEETITLHTKPSRTAALFLRNPVKPILLVEKKSDGAIRMDPLTARLLFVSDRTGEQGATPIPSRQDTSFTYDDRNIADFIRHSTEMAASRFLTSRWKQITGHNITNKPGLSDDIQNITNRIMRTSAKGVPSPKDLIAKLAQAVRSMVDPLTWERAHPEGPSSRPISRFRYNAAATLGAQVDQLRISNPGALTWALHNCNATEAINHPGQIIALAKEQLLQQGLDPKNWKFAAKLDAPLMAVLAADQFSQRGAHILNDLAQEQAKPTSTVISTMLGFRTPPSGRNNGILQSNTSAITRLLAKESAAKLRQHPGDPKQASLTQQVTDVWDLVIHLSQQGNYIHSKTWKRLQRRAQAWHQKLRRISAQKRWEQALSSQNGKYLAWHSGLDAFEVDHYTVTPLDNEKMLHQESARMGHCVYSYTERCAQGASRIFSISTKDGPVATGEIVRTAEGWKPNQTKAPGNHQASRELLEVMEETARLYTSQNQAQEVQTDTYRWIKDSTGLLQPDPQSENNFNDKSH